MDALKTLPFNSQGVAYEVKYRPWAQNPYVAVIQSTYGQIRSKFSTLALAQAFAVSEITTLLTGNYIPTDFLGSIPINNN